MHCVVFAVVFSVILVTSIFVDKAAGIDVQICLLFW